MFAVLCCWSSLLHRSGPAAGPSTCSLLPRSTSATTAVTLTLFLCETRCETRCFSSPSYSRSTTTFTLPWQRTLSVTSSVSSCLTMICRPYIKRAYHTFGRLCTPSIYQHTNDRETLLVWSELPASYAPVVSMSFYQFRSTRPLRNSTIDLPLPSAHFTNTAFQTLYRPITSFFIVTTPRLANASRLSLNVIDIAPCRSTQLYCTFLVNFFDDRRR